MPKTATPSTSPSPAKAPKTTRKPSPPTCGSRPATTTCSPPAKTASPSPAKTSRTASDKASKPAKASSTTTTQGSYSARISADDDNAITWDSDNGLYARGVAAAIRTCCGITGAGTASSPLAVNPAPWGFTCPPENGETLGCGSDGVLYGRPSNRVGATVHRRRAQLDTVQPGQRLRLVPLIHDHHLRPR